jgi:NAD(P)H-dependent flavin oxidoreductase YrpB (nitropropane dioxygenase family)
MPVGIMMIAAGGEAGGHCGDVATLVLVPEVLQAIRSYGDSRSARGRRYRHGPTNGRMGGRGAWTGSVWLTTAEAETNLSLRKNAGGKFASTVRSKAAPASTGGVAFRVDRRVASAGGRNGGLVSEPALAKINKLAEAGDPGAKQLATYWVGQGVGLMNTSMSVRSVVFEFMEDFATACERMNDLMAD